MSEASSSAGKTYGQVCPLARSLDVLGDRWTLLVVRELLLGPKRFKELLAILPAMGTNRLSDRTALLVEKGVMRRVRLTGRGNPEAYELTAFGEGLRKPVLALGFWGLGLPMDPRIDPSKVRAELIALCLTGAGPSPAARDLRAVYDFEVGTEAFHVRVDNGALAVRSGRSGEPADIRLRCDTATFLALALGEITPDQATGERGAELLQGDAKSFQRMMNALEYRP